MRHINTLVAVVAMSVALPACDDEPGVETYSAPKDPKRALRPSSTGDPVPGGVNTPAAPANVEIIRWQLPAGWSRPPGVRRMRFATLQGGEGDNAIEVAVSTFVGPQGKGGGLLMNINRWRGQLGLGSINAAQLPDQTTIVKTRNAQAIVADITGKAGDEPARMLATTIFRPGRAWFFKTIAAPGALEQHREAYMELIESVQFMTPDSAMMTPLAGSQTPAVPTGITPPRAPLTWTAPAHWQQDPQPRPPRLASFQIREGGGAAEATVTRLPGNVGTLLMNVNRWRGQLGLKPVDAITGQTLTPVNIAGQRAELVDITGADQSMLVVIVKHAQMKWFFKVVGDAGVVTNQRDAYMSWVESIDFR